MQQLASLRSIFGLGQSATARTRLQRLWTWRGARSRASLASERDPDKLAELAEGRLSLRIPALRLALEGRCTEHHKSLLRHLLEDLDYLEGEIKAFSTRLEGCLRPFVPEEVQRRLGAILEPIGGQSKASSPRSAATWASLPMPTI